MAKPTPLALLVLVGLAVPVITGGVATVHAEFEFGVLDVDMEVTGVVKEAGTSTDRYTFTVEVTNPTTKTTYAGYLDLVADGRHDNECPNTYDERLEPGESAVFTGCYTVSKGDEPVGVDILGTTDPNAEYLDFLAVLPFTAEFWEGCRSYIYDHEPNICLPVQSITHLIRDVQPGDTSTNPTQTTTPSENDAAITPTQPIEDTILSHASYDLDTNQLILNFTEKFNPFLVDMTKINIEDEPCAVTFTWQEYDIPTNDRLAIIIEPNEQHRETLAKMDQPVVRIYDGAFISSVDGEDFGWGRTGLEVTGDVPDDRTPCAITYGFNDSLLRVYARNYTEMLQGVHDGFNDWSELNPYLSFVHVESDPLIWVDWIEYAPDHIGRACLDCLAYGATMDVSLYDYNCRGERIYREPDYVRNIIAHELGHILGLDHHVNKTHLMYGPEYQVDPYVSYGYVVPDALEEWYIGEAELHERIQVLEDEIDRLADEIDRLEAKGDVVGDTIYFDTQRQINEYDRLFDEYGEVWNKYNAAFDEMDCMYEPHDPQAGGE